jgi:GntR family transcriptional regulator
MPVVSEGEMLDSNNVTPLYKQLLDDIRVNIEQGMYKPGDKLLPETEMARYYKVSVITARKAMDELAAMGLVKKRRGKGTFVANPKYSRDYTKVLSFSEACKLQNLEAGSELLERNVITPPLKICQDLGLPDNSKTVYVLRLRFVNKEPMVIESNYFPMSYAYLLSEDLSGSLFEVLRVKSGVDIQTSRKTVEICRANAAERRLLSVGKNHSLLLVNSIACTADGTPVYSGTQIINGERYKLLI